MDIKRLLKRQEGVQAESQENPGKPQEETETEVEVPENVIQFQFDESLGSDSTDVMNYSDFSGPNISSSSTQEHLVRQRQNRLCLASIGRSVSDNPQTSASASTSTAGNTKKFALTDIGRSFSVAAEDELFETGSCPNPSSLHASSNVISEGNNSSSSNLVLATSMPVSPVGRQKAADSSQPISEGNMRSKKFLLRDSSFQSDSSHCSSVESLLESRRPDPEAILINLGFGPPRTEDVLSKIPKRFLKPSQVRGVDTEEFLKKQQLAKHLHETSVLGYRGLIGNPDIAPSHIVAKIMERFQLNDQTRMSSCDLLNNNRPCSAPPTPMHSHTPHHLASHSMARFKK